MNGMFFPRNHQFYDTFDKKLKQLFTAGLIIHYESDHFKCLNEKRYKHLHPEGPKVLTFDNLKAGFVIWLVSICLAIAAFVIECIIWMKDFLALKFILEAFYKIRKGKNVGIVKAKAKLRTLETPKFVMVLPAK